VQLIPVSALAGDNVVEPSTAMPWYTGPTLLHYLETVPLHTRDEALEPLRFPVQLVLRPDANFRGFAGRVERGEVRPGDHVRALPSGKTTRVKTIVSFDGDMNAAAAPRSVTLELEDEIDLSRGDLLVRVDEPEPAPARAFRAMVVWMHEQPLEPGATFLAKFTTQRVRATVQAIRYRVDVTTAEHLPATQLHMNDIAEVEFTTSLPLYFDSYAQNRTTGSLILIDPLSNATVGAAMIVASVAEHVATKSADAAFVLCASTEQAAQTVEAMEARGERAVLLDDPDITEAALPSVARALQLAGVTAVLSRRDISATTLTALRNFLGTRLIENEEAAKAWLERNS
jgi:bifunctional enzyme CysN/CysC/sulfate adenylyltransferase subunit 1